jgi:hypothetical protein
MTSGWSGAVKRKDNAIIGKMMKRIQMRVNTEKTGGRKNALPNIHNKDMDRPQPRVKIKA